VDKFQDYFRIPSARADWWNYGAPGIYFLTICSAYHECLFGSILNNEVILSEPGMIVLQEWEKSFEMRLELFCDAFVIMPNHIHAVLRIVEINNNQQNITDIVNMNMNSDIPVETHGRASLTIESMDSPIKYGVAYRPPKSISSFVAGFKSAATTQINEFRKMPGITVWQSRFHDHIIRDEVEYWKIIRYIELNPKNWKEDKYYK